MNHSMPNRFPSFSSSPHPIPADFSPFPACPCYFITVPSPSKLSHPHLHPHSQHSHHTILVNLCSMDLPTVSCECAAGTISLQCSDTVGWVTARPVKAGCWFVGGDDLTGALHVL